MKQKQLLKILKKPILIFLNGMKVFAVALHLEVISKLNMAGGIGSQKFINQTL